MKTMTNFNLRYIGYRSLIKHFVTNLILFAATYLWLYSQSVMGLDDKNRVCCFYHLFLSFWVQYKIHSLCFNTDPILKDIEKLAIILVPLSLIMILSRGHTGQIKG